MHLTQKANGGIIRSSFDGWINTLHPCFSGAYAPLEYNAALGGSGLSTAIVSTYVSSKGFIIGADGMSHNPATGQTILTAQKLFDIQHPDATLVYGWAGATIMNDDGGAEVFNIQAASADVGKSLRPDAINFDGYVGRFMDGVRSVLLRARETGRLPRYPDLHDHALGSGFIARLLLVGYFCGSPCRAEAYLRHSSGVLQEPEILNVECPPAENFCISNGSRIVWEILQPKVQAPKHLAEAANLVRRYLEDCIANRNRYQDCKDIDGHIHMASLTPRGFRWIEPPAG
jgi:hypothetical protein